MLKAYDGIEDKKALLWLCKEYEETFLDDSFQRRGGEERGSGWTTTAAEEYIGNFLANRTANQVIRAEVKECLKYAQDQSDKESEAYYQGVLNKGKKYVSVDGNNTSSAVYHFIRKDLNRIDPTDNSKCKFLDYSEEEQTDIQASKIPVWTLRRASYNDLCELFRNINKNTPVK